MITRDYAVRSRSLTGNGMAALLFTFSAQALDYLPRKADDDWLQELRWIYDRRDAQGARQDLSCR
jgi:transposase-like protein